ncbi:hypothetical protein GQ43DRAFT_227163 [Delitschia confertaspora ATCC 74209]|uniref:BCAS3 domain-containing protein n=1 Tax=Delitschia confertaspora ATCC 74209 TaxID=1513339 RepID=A0A9P4MNI1_9PLEO|nr:hypothetical protein GQ43DRAFT_227163 [Delitschia confertaspora ATCC 74209]
MSPSPDSVEHTSPPPNLGYIYQQQRNRTRAVDNLHVRGRDTSKYELGRRDRYGERVTRIYPREIAKSPPAVKRYSSPSGPQTYNATTSPLLSALGTTKSTAAQYTSEWTKSLPFVNQPSPNKGIAIAGSPPAFHNSPGTRDLYGQAGISSSPTAPGVRPLSHPNHYSSFGGRLQTPPRQSPGRDRRSSMYSQYGAKPFATNPPLPHQPQTHYYNLPEIDLGLDTTGSDGITPGEGGYFCGFDTLSTAGDEPSRTAENVLIVGYEGGVELFRVERSKMDVIGRLEGLRGSVIGAKIIPWTSRRDPFSAARPLIVLVIHGPVVNEDRDSQNTSGSSSVIDDSSSRSASRPGSSRADGESTAKITHYQTTVEVYSLKRKERVAVLYKSPLIPITIPIDSPVFEPPPSFGDFSVDAKGKFVVVASGASGEVFIFAPYFGSHSGHHEKFRCIGKVWTTVQLRERGTHSSASSAAEGNSHEEATLDKYGVPIFSLSHRWLAVTPPSSSTLLPVNGVALTSASNPRPIGLAYHTVPPQPTTNCTVDVPEPDSLINRLTREGTQAAIKSARWATEKGIQAFKNYMGKTAPATSNTNGGLFGDPMQAYFPPTHAHNQTQPREEAMVISIYDLQKLFDAEETKAKNALNPISTVPASLGCSHLSFSPSGLMLMTVSKKGDVQDVWDLKRINFRRTRRSARDIPSGPHVRQVARFARMTVTNVVDVAWSSPRGDRLAVITDKGTVHMFLMPASAFQWPPPRRNRKPAQTTKPKQEEGPPNGGRGGAVTSAMQVINGTAKPWLDVVRTRTSSNGGSRFPSLSSLGIRPAAGAKSGKAVAVNVGKSLSSIRHAGDNKLPLPTSSSGVKPNALRWFTGKGRGSLGLVAGGVLQIYRIQMRPATSKGKSSSATSITKKKIVEFGLTPVRNTLFPPSIAALLQAPSVETLPNANDIHGEWLPRALPPRRGAKVIAPAPLSFSEIETNPPYQPFYTDRRVTRFVFSREAPTDLQYSRSVDFRSQYPPGLLSNLHHKNDDSPWLFGEDVEVTRISSPAGMEMFGDDYEDDEIGDTAARLENKLVLRDGEEEVEQIVVTTRRKRVRAEGDSNAEGEEGFFEDDCDVLDFAEDRV